MDDKILESLYDGSFSVECKDIYLYKESDSQNPEMQYRGPGIISQEATGTFSVKIYCSGNISPTVALNGIFGMSGKIYEQSDYYSLIATSIKDTIWEAKWILPQIETGMRFEGYLVHGSFNEMCYKEKPRGSGYWAQLFYKGKYEIPCNTVTSVKKAVGGEERESSWDLNIATFEACGFDFEIRSLDEWLIVKLYSKTQEIDETFAQRVNEAVQFLLAKTQAWSVLSNKRNDTEEIRVRSNVIDKRHSMAFPPVEITKTDRSNNAWRLFERYLYYCSSYKEIGWHPMFDLVYRIIEAGKVYLDVYALTLSVAVEGLLKQEFVRVAKLKEEDIVALDAAYLELLKNENIDEEIKKRLRGAIASMKLPRAKDRLIVLQNRELIEKKLVKAWNTLRNSSAHADSLNPMKIQEYLNNCNAVCLLFYHLIFLVVGYEGNYLDYSSYGFPRKKFEAKKHQL